MLPLDLHVLGLPLAFILSQDQTLRCKITLNFSETQRCCSFLNRCFLIPQYFNELLLINFKVSISTFKNPLIPYYYLFFKHNLKTFSSIAGCKDNHFFYSNYHLLKKIKKINRIGILIILDLVTPLRIITSNFLNQDTLNV